MSPALRASFLSLASLFAMTATVTATESVASAQATAPAKSDTKKPDSKDKGHEKDKAPAGAATPTEPAPPAEVKAATPADAPKEEGNEEKDTDRAIYLSGDIGFTRYDIGGLSDSTGFDKTGANGIMAGIGVGYRHKEFRFGGRFREWSTTEYSLWSVMGEIGYGLKMRPLSPTFYVHAGYVWDTGIERGAFSTKIPQGNILTPDVDLNGLVVGGEIVASYWVTKFLRVGPFIGFDVTVLHRSQPDPPSSIFQVPDEVKNNDLFGKSGNGLGYVLSIGIRLTGDVGF